MAHSSFNERQSTVRLTRSSTVETPMSRLILAGPVRPRVPARVISTETSRLEHGMFIPGVSSAWKQR